MSSQPAGWPLEPVGVSQPILLTSALTKIKSASSLENQSVSSLPQVKKKKKKGSVILGGNETTLRKDVLGQCLKPAETAVPHLAEKY